MKFLETANRGSNAGRGRNSLEIQGHGINASSTTNSHGGRDNGRISSEPIEATKAKTWMTRGISFNVDYAKALLL